MLRKASKNQHYRKNRTHIFLSLVFFLGGGGFELCIRSAHVTDFR